MMKRNLVTIILSIAIVFAFHHKVNAEFLVDTGQPVSTSSYDVDSDQWLASEFSIDSTYTLTDIHGFMRTNYSGTPLTEAYLTLAIYGDGGAVPNMGNELYNQAFSVQTDDTGNWYGLSGLDWTLSQGSYWLAFEVREGQDFAGAMHYSSPNPLENEAFWTVNYSTDPTYISQGLDIGVRIQSNIAVVPEPVSSALFIIGGATLGFRRFMKKRKTA